MRRVIFIAFVILKLNVITTAQNGTIVNRLIGAEKTEPVTSNSVARNSTTKGKEGIDFRIAVYDAKEKIPIGLARVVLQCGKKVIAQEATNTTGQVWFRDIQPGSYTLTGMVRGLSNVSQIQF